MSTKLNALLAVALLAIGLPAADAAEPVTLLGRTAAVDSAGDDTYIDVPETCEADAFVVAKVVIGVPDDPIPAKLKYSVNWSLPEGYEDGKNVLRECDGEQLRMVPLPGKHALTARVTVSMEVWAVNPDFPDDPTKAIIVPFTLVLGEPTATFTVGPAPEPEPDPDPEPEEGSRLVYIVRESGDDTPEFQQLVLELRAGKSAEWLSAQGHKLTILDDDERDGRGNRAPALVKIDAALAGLTLPALVITDADGKVLSKANIGPGTTGANVVEAITRTGG